jgi:hypothetical protein
MGGKMKPEFDAWWDGETDYIDNPYSKSTPAFWAWEGWCAGQKAQRETDAKLCEKLPRRLTSDYEQGFDDGCNECLDAIRRQK